MPKALTVLPWFRLISEASARRLGPPHLSRPFVPVGGELLLHIHHVVSKRHLPPGLGKLITS